MVDHRTAPVVEADRIAVPWEGSVGRIAVPWEGSVGRIAVPWEGSVGRIAVPWEGPVGRIAVVEVEHTAGPWEGSVVPSVGVFLEGLLTLRDILFLLLLSRRHLFLRRHLLFLRKILLAHSLFSSWFGIFWYLSQHVGEVLTVLSFFGFGIGPGIGY